MAVIIIAGVLLLLFLGLSLLQKTVYRRLWSKNLTYSLQSSKSAVFEGDKVVITDRISNGKKLPLPWVHVSYKLSRFLVYLDNISQKINRGEHRTFLYTVGANKSITRKSTVLCSKRGFYTATEFTFACNNLFMTGSSRIKDSVDFNLTVYPKAVDYPESIIPLNKMLGDVSVRRFIDPDPFTFKGVREYQSYDSFKQINWKATAKSGEIMSTIYDFTVFQDVTVILDLYNSSEYDKDFIHEEAIRIAAFICRSCIMRNIPVSLVCPAPDGNPVKLSSGLSTVHLEKVYTALAFIKLKNNNLSVRDFIPSGSDKAYVIIFSDVENGKVELVANFGDTISVEVKQSA